MTNLHEPQYCSLTANKQQKAQQQTQHTMVFLQNGNGKVQEIQVPDTYMCNSV